MSDKRQIRVIFFQVKSSAAKKELLISKATEHFEKSLPLLFRLPGKEGLDYLDQLLWSNPPDSFLPHAIDSPHLIVLTADKTANPGRAHAVFNLQKMPEDNLSYQFHQIYEFDDLSSSSPTTRDHYEFYKKKGYTIVTL
jgi:DNA polymerase IIIc chi subunit